MAGHGAGAPRSVRLPTLTYCVVLCIVRHMVELDEATPKFEAELRRGVLALATISQLRDPQYGYSLRQALAAHGVPIEEGTLYPLLRRLESQGLVASEWRMEDGPPRRYYVLNAEGQSLYRRLTEAWHAQVSTMNNLLDDAETKET